LFASFEFDRPSAPVHSGPVEIAGLELPPQIAQSSDISLNVGLIAYRPCQRMIVIFVIAGGRVASATIHKMDLLTRSAAAASEGGAIRLTDRMPDVGLADGCDACVSHGARVKRRRAAMFVAWVV
jgi:hypothetical protein